MPYTNYFAELHGRARMSRPRRRGLTLIEIMVSTTLSLLLILALAQSFVTVSDTISKGRATLEMAERMRGTILRLSIDLEEVSAPTLPWLDPAVGAGYFEVVEGFARDYDANANALADWSEAGGDTSWGDCDDVLSFTVISETAPFVGYVMGTLTDAPGGRIGKFQLDFNVASPRTRTKISSNAAEIIWFTTLNDLNRNGVRDLNETYTLHRRVLLIRPDIEIGPSLAPTALADPFFAWGNDLSVTVDGATNRRVTNSLQDLTDRRRRLAHNSTFPFALNRALLGGQRNVWLPGPDGAWGRRGIDDDGDGVQDGNDIDEAGAIESDDLLIAENAGQDVILTGVLAFDVKVFDPLAPLKDAANGADLLGPEDPRYWQINVNPTGAGEFVDLGYALHPVTGAAYPIPYASAFSGPPQVRPNQARYLAPTWDTWPLLYEMDGVDNDDLNANAALNLIDEGFDGLDNDRANGVDDLEERETVPPYNVPLRGIKVIVRAIDPTSRQVRQEHVITGFQPE